MERAKKEGRYKRIIDQLDELTSKPGTTISRMATIAAVLHHKMENYFWTGFYILDDKKLTAGPYQGPVACQELANQRGVCWASITRGAALIVPDVSRFPGHIACDSRSKSEICIPVKDKNGEIKAVLDVDAKELNQFDNVDELYLHKIAKFIYR